MAERTQGETAPATEGMRDRGHLKVFLGMAAGVGKTYRMLQEGRAEAESGRDIVIRYLEPHGRKETVDQADGLESVPRRRVPYWDTVLEEMDTLAVIARAPDLALIDELAHTNAPGLEHEKRYDDVRDVLNAGIDVYSTVNVQHLESLNDSVCELTGVRVRETLPDAVLNEADEVVLMDLTPEALLTRLREGKIYPAERIDSALNNFFRIENLAALREVALRQVAQEVEAKRMVKETVGQREDRLADSAASQAVGERLLALIKPTPRAQRLGPPSVAVRAAARRGSRPALGEAARVPAEPGGAEPARRDRAAGSGAWSALDGRGGRRCGAGRQGSGRGEGQHLRTDRDAISADRSRPVPAGAPNQADRVPTRRRPSRRRRPRAQGRGGRAMSPVEIVLIGALLGSTGYLLVRELKRRRTDSEITPAASRILFPFVGQALSTPAFDAAARLARAEGATLVPAYLAIVPLSVQLDTPLRKQAEAALPLLEAIEQRAASQGVPSIPGSSLGGAFGTRCAN